MNEISIGLWRNKESFYPLDHNSKKYPIERIFPSGRQCITFALETVGLNRKSRVALPEWSSHCVISSIGKIATPIPFNEVINNNLKVDAILFYEQWGWPISKIIRSRLLEMFDKPIIFLDRVDSADIDNENRTKFYPDLIQIDIISLSKLLGLKGGGLAKLNGNYLTFKTDLLDTEISNFIWSSNISKDFPLKFIYLHMNDLKVLHPELINWLDKNDLVEVLNIECRDRRNNLSKFINSNLNLNWPKWMFDAFKEDASPGIVPLFRNKPLNLLMQVRNLILKKFSVETSVYHFNWSGNPFIPEYEPVLAFPIHGMVKTIIPEIIETLGCLYNLEDNNFISKCNDK